MPLKTLEKNIKNIYLDWTITQSYLFNQKDKFDFRNPDHFIGFVTGEFFHKEDRHTFVAFKQNLENSLKQEGVT